MIARVWHGWTSRADAKIYEKLLREEIFPEIAGRNIPGYHGAELFMRDDGDEVEFMTLLRFESMAGVEWFAGADKARPIIWPKAEPLLKSMDKQSQHYRIALSA